MTDKKNKPLDTETIAIRSGQVRTAENEHSDPIFASSSYVFADAAEAAARFKGDRPGNIYSRFTNPTVRTFEERLAALEGGERCIGTSSGMSAILCTILGLLKAGDHIVSSASIFGTTVNLLATILPKYGITTTFVEMTDYSAWEKEITAKTRLFFLETPSNPLTTISDIKKLADIAHNSDLWLVVDNCFCTPALQLPLQHGADIVIHSATKYLDGQGRFVGGAIVGPESLLAEDIYNFLRHGGACMSAFNAWVFLKGLETLSVRMKAHCENAALIASWLAEQRAVKTVHYPGLQSHPQYDLARQQQTAPGGIVSFEVQGGRVSAWRLIDALSLFSITANLGDTKSTVTHPATTTHHRLSDEQRLKAGITPGLVRLSVGLESAADLLSDLERAFLFVYG